MRKPTILFADEDAHLHHTLHQHLYETGCDVILTLEPEYILRTIERKNPDLAMLGTSNGLGLAKQIRQQYQNLPIILLARQSSEAQVLEALKSGVNDYFTMPFSYEEIAASVTQQLGTSRKSISPLKISPDSSSPCTHPILGQSLCMRQIKEYLLKVAATDSTVLITGETGTGKELVAELIHRHSLRHAKPFICINCAALPDNLVESELFGYDKGAFTGAVVSRQGEFEQANHGTVFLDEIGDMSAMAQVKILRAIERKEVYHLGGKKTIPLNVRIIAATNHNPEALIREDLFRKDLYYRLNVARIHLPSLRDRKEDIPCLIAYYLEKFNHQFGRDVQGLTELASELLLQYDWPGNIRELKNLLEATFINLPSEKITFMDLPESFRRRLKETEGLSKSERDQLLSALFATNWNKSKAAQKLHWSRMTLYRKMAKYDINVTSLSAGVTPS